MAMDVASARAGRERTHDSKHRLQCIEQNLRKEFVHDALILADSNTVPQWCCLPREYGTRFSVQLQLLNCSCLFACTFWHICTLKCFKEYGASKLMGER